MTPNMSLRKIQVIVFILRSLPVMLNQIPTMIVRRLYNLVFYDVILIYTTNTDLATP